MSEKRRDNRNRILREGEYQRKDGRYRFRYIDEDGKEKNVYSCVWTRMTQCQRGRSGSLPCVRKKNRLKRICLTVS